LTERYLMDAMF